MITGLSIKNNFLFYVSKLNIRINFNIPQWKKFLRLDTFLILFDRRFYKPTRFDGILKPRTFNHWGCDNYDAGGFLVRV